MPDQEKLAWLRLSRTRGIGPVTFAGLLQRFGSAEAALDALPELLREKRSSVSVASEGAASAELEHLTRMSGKLICSVDPDFPALLRELDPPPPIISVFGDASLLSKPSIALVGARNASAAGRKIARDMAADLGQAGFVIVSGLARGIDGEAHAASLQSGTIAVLGGGVDQIYPPQHDKLYRAIAEQGLIVSESPFGHKATAKDFPRRNRIITGLALGTVVIEAAERSGSLISARTANEQNREVMAVPGSPLEPRSAGTNRLIRQGATLVRSADDVLDQINALPQHRPPQQGFLFEPTVPYSERDTASQADIDRVLEALSFNPMPIAEIARAADIAVSHCAAILVELELKGQATTLAGGLASRLSD